MGVPVSVGVYNASTCGWMSGRPVSVGVYVLVQVGEWVCIYSVCYVVGVGIFIRK